MITQANQAVNGLHICHEITILLQESSQLHHKKRILSWDKLGSGFIMNEDTEKSPKQPDIKAFPAQMGRKIGLLPLLR